MDPHRGHRATRATFDAGSGPVSRFVDGGRRRSLYRESSNVRSPTGPSFRKLHAGESALAGAFAFSEEAWSRVGASAAGEVLLAAVDASVLGSGADETSATWAPTALAAGIILTPAGRAASVLAVGVASAAALFVVDVALDACRVAVAIALDLSRVTGRGLVVARRPRLAGRNAGAAAVANLGVPGA